MYFQYINLPVCQLSVRVYWVNYQIKQNKDLTVMIRRLICINQVSHDMKVSKDKVLKSDGRICHKQGPFLKLEDLKVLRHSPDLFNHVKKGQGQLQGILIKHILFYHIWGLQPFWSSDLKQSIEYSVKQPSDF